MPTPKMRFTLEEGAQAPSRAYDGDAGFDLYARHDYNINPGDYVQIRTGVHIEAPKGYFTRITARSSTFRAYGLMVVEGIIDNGYRGELTIGVINPSPRKYTRVPQGARIAQLLVHRIYNVDWQQVEKLNDSARSTRGFGSSGK